jgi:ADP-heptose:LPS heptosyltransferase
VLSSGIAACLAARGEHVEVATGRRFRAVFDGLSLKACWTPESLAGAGRFDRVIDLQANATSRRLLAGLGAVTRHRSRAFDRRWIVVWGRRPPRPRIPHVVERYAEAAGLAGLPIEALRPRIAVTEEDRAAGMLLQRSWEVSGTDCVGLAEGASRRMKRWPEESFARLGEALRGRGLKTLRFLDPATGPQLQDARADGGVEQDGAVRATLRPLKALLARCRAVVTNDSGVMHLAVGLGVPVVALFGSTVLELGFGPLGERDQVIERDLACRPCAVHGARFCWLGHGRCLTAITPEEVLEYVLRVTGEEES